MLSSPCPSEERLPEIAFVTDIRGLCSAGWTPQTCTQAQHARLRRPQLLSCHQCPTLQIAWQEFDEALLTVWYPHIDASPNFVICVTEGGVGLRTDQSGYWTLQPAPVWLGPHHGAERWAGRCETQGDDAAESGGRRHGAAHRLRPQIGRPGWFFLRRYRLGRSRRRLQSMQCRTFWGSAPVDQVNGSTRSAKDAARSLAKHG